MSVPNVIKFQTIKLQDYYLSSISERVYAEERTMVVPSKGELLHRRRLRKMQSKGFLQRAAMKVSELFQRDRMAS
ncbi:MAG: hypothetical protein P4L53_00735 [Candidatus Obscuribacterales bacterium]|nr:hypothetical protein [Candidatus Obscuribacterales bacterium]